MKTEMKKCVRCGKEYPATREYFHLNQGRLRAECKHCTNEMARKRAFDKRAKAEKTGLDAFVGLCDYLHKEGCIKDEWHKDFISMANEKKEMTKCNLALHELANLLDEACDKLRLCADACGVEVKGGEDTILREGGEK